MQELDADRLVAAYILVTKEETELRVALDES